MRRFRELGCLHRVLTLIAASDAESLSQIRDEPDTSGPFESPVPLRSRSNIGWCAVRCRGSQRHQLWLRTVARADGKEKYSSGSSAEERLGTFEWAAGLEGFIRSLQIHRGQILVVDLLTFNLPKPDVPPTHFLFFSRAFTERASAERAV
jgi:hypothetical protein